MERNTRTKAEREYIKGIIQNLSLKRLTDQEIVNYLHDEKQIEIARSTVTNTRISMEKQAEKWYIDLRNSAYRYLAQYKQRIDSLLSYQRTLHDIISTTKKDEVKIRAISELHSIEMDIFSLWKQLPVSNIVSPIDNSENEKKGQWAVQLGEGNKIPQSIAHEIPGLGDEEPVIGYGSEAWTVDGIKESTTSTPASIVEQKAEAEQEITTSLEQEELSTTTTTSLYSKDSETKDAQERPRQKDNDTIDIDLLGRTTKVFDIEPWVQCKVSDCNKWFKTKEIQTKHFAKYHT